MIVHAGQRAGHKLREWCGAGIDFIGKDPQVPGAQAAILAPLQAQGGQCNIGSGRRRLILGNARQLVGNHRFGVLRYSGAHSTQ